MDCIADAAILGTDEGGPSVGVCPHCYEVFNPGRLGAYIENGRPVVVEA
jgi:hypothetical protein